MHSIAQYTLERERETYYIYCVYGYMCSVPSVPDQSR